MIETWMSVLQKKLLNNSSKSFQNEETTEQNDTR